MGAIASQPARAARGKKPSLAATAAAITKTIIGASAAKPVMVELPQAVAEIHVSPEEMIPAGTVITQAIAEEAGLDEDDVQALIDAGHAALVAVYKQDVESDAADA